MAAVPCCTGACRMGLVAARKEGLNVHYRIADPRVFDMMRALEAIFCPQDEP